MKNKYFSVPEFETKEGVEEILCPMPNSAKFYKDKNKLNKKYIGKVSMDMQSFYQYPLLSREQEFHLFRQMNYYKWLISLDVEQEYNFKKMMEVKNLIIGCNVRLILSIVRKQAEYLNSQNNTGLLSTLISDGSMAIVRASDYFDYRRGIKFSTYATWAIIRFIAQERNLRYRHSHLFHTNHDETVFESIPCGYHTEEDFDKSELVDFIFSKLKDDDKVIVDGLYFKGEKIIELGERLNLKKDKIMKMKKNIFEKVRELIEDKI